MKKTFLGTIALCLFSLAPLVAGGQSDGNQRTGSGTKTIYFYQNKIEIDQALKKVVQEYESAHPDVRFVVESVSENYPTSLRTKFAGGQAPDIFSITGGIDLQLWQSRLENLNDQSWTGDLIPLAKAGITGSDGAVYGMPVSVEGYGYVYNKRLFAQAGITELPKTLPELKEVVEKLKAAGIQPLAGTYMDWYQAGMFLVNMGFARQPDPMAFIAGLNNGTATFAGNKVFEDVANFILYDFSQCKSPLNTGFNQQTSQLMGEQIAMTLGGTWLQPSIDAANPGMQVGLMPLPVNGDQAANDKLYAGVTGYWVLNKDSKVKPEVKEFFSWLITSEEGRKALTDDLLFIPGFSSIKANQERIGPLGKDLADYTARNSVYGIYNSLYPSGGAEAFGNAVQMLVAGKLDVPGFLSELQKQWNQLKKQN